MMILRFICYCRFAAFSGCACSRFMAAQNRRGGERFGRLGFRRPSGQARPVLSDAAESHQADEARAGEAAQRIDHADRSILVEREHCEAVEIDLRLILQPGGQQAAQRQPATAIGVGGIAGAHATGVARDHPAVGKRAGQRLSGPIGHAEAYRHGFARAQRPLVCFDEPDRRDRRLDRKAVAFEPFAQAGGRRGSGRRGTSQRQKANEPPPPARRAQGCDGFGIGLPRCGVPARVAAGVRSPRNCTISGFWRFSLMSWIARATAAAEGRGSGRSGVGAGIKAVTVALPPPADRTRTGSLRSTISVPCWASEHFSESHAPVRGSTGTVHGWFFTGVGELGTLSITLIVTCLAISPVSGLTVLVPAM